MMLVCNKLTEILDKPYLPNFLFTRVSPIFHFIRLIGVYWWCTSHTYRGFYSIQYIKPILCITFTREAQNNLWMIIMWLIGKSEDQTTRRGKFLQMHITWSGKISVGIITHTITVFCWNKWPNEILFLVFQRGGI